MDVVDYIEDTYPNWDNLTKESKEHILLECMCLGASMLDIFAAGEKWVTC